MSKDGSTEYISYKIIDSMLIHKSSVLIATLAAK